MMSKLSSIVLCIYSKIIFATLYNCILNNVPNNLKEKSLINVKEIYEIKMFMNIYENLDIF